MLDLATFRLQLGSGDPSDILTKLLFEGVPFVFAGNVESFRDWRTKAASQLQVDPCEIVLIGSGATGYSLSPHKNLKLFSATSDVDVAIISERHFAEAWHQLRTIDITLASLSPAQRIALKEHAERYIYWGCVATDRILALLPFAKQWMNAASSLS